MSSICRISSLFQIFSEQWQHIWFGVHNLLTSRTSALFLREYFKRQAITILWLMLIVVTSLLLHRLAMLLMFWIKGNQLPGPSLNVPLGCSVVADFSIHLSSLHKQYGPVVKVWLGPTQLLVSVNDHEIVKKVMVFSKDRIPAPRTALELAFGKESIFISTHIKARMKRLSLHQALDGNLIDILHSTSIYVCNRIANCTSPSLSSMELDVQVLSKHMVFSVLGTILFGESFLVWPSAGEFETLLFTISEKVCYWARYPLTPFWTYGFKQYKNMCLRAQCLVEDILALTRHMKDNASTSVTEQKAKRFYEGILSSTKDAAPNYAQEVLEALVDGLSVDQDIDSSLQDIRDNLFGLMFHGCRMMALVISSVLTMLAQHPEIQDKLHAEIDMVCGARSPPSTDDIRKMKYLLAVIYESARLLPPKHILQRCTLDEDLVLAHDTIIPAGAIIAFPVRIMSMDAKIWGPDVEKFNPDRFLQPPSGSDEKSLGYVWRSLFGNASYQERADVTLGSENKQTSSEDKLSFNNLAANFSFLLFGGGSRACVGSTLALTEITSLLASLLQCYKVGFGESPEVPNITALLSPSARLELVPRNK